MVSVVIPTYGRPRHLLRAITSVVESCFKDLQVVVVDDNDPDSRFRADTERLMENFSNYENVFYLKHSENKNGSAARNTGLRFSSGKYICFLDDDDEFLPDKISDQVSFMEKNGCYAACYCKTLYFVDGRLVNKSKFSKSGNFSEDVFMLRSQCNTSSLMFRREAIEYLNGFDESYTRHQDVELLIRFFKFYSMGFVDKFLLRRHLESRMNMPPLDVYIDLKKKFLKEFDLEVKKFPEKTQKKIYATHCSDLFFYCLRSFEFKRSCQFYPGFGYVCAFLYYNIRKVPGIFVRSFKRRLTREV